MKKRLKQFSVGFLACMMATSVVGCSSKAGTEAKPVTAEKKTEEKKTEEAGAELSADEPGWMRNKDDQVKLDWYVNFSWFNTPWGEDITSQTITEETGVDIQFITPAGNEAEKVNTMIASDTLPDIITLGWWEGQVNEIISSDMVYALNELADEYDPYFHTVADPSRIGWYTKEDGNVYGYPNSSFSPQDYEKYENIASNETFLVRKDMYEALGSPDMTTPEGFYETLERAKEMFPEVNGQPLIPLGFHEFGDTGNWSLEGYLQDFLAVPYEKDGKLYDRTTDPDYVEWLKVLSKAGDAGLLANEIFIDKRSQMGEKIAQGRYFAMLYQRSDMASEQKILYDKDPESIYMAVDGPRNANQDPHTLPGGGIQGWTVTMISKNCKRPDRAIELMSYMMSEHGQKMIFLGPEGVTYDMVDGKPQVKPEVMELLTTDRAAYDRQYGADDTFWMLQDNAMQLQWVQGSPGVLSQMEEWTYEYAISNSQYADIQAPADSEEAIIGLKIATLWGQTLPKLLLGGEDKFDETFAEFVKQRDALGLEKLQAYQQQRFKENKVKLGLE